MPELPEVHTTATVLNTLLPGLTITDVWTDYESKHHAGKDNIKDPAYFKKFKKAVIGQKIESVSRRAKNVLIHLVNKKTILIHMKMTGHVLYGTYDYDKKKNAWIPKEPETIKDPFSRFIHLLFKLSNGKHAALCDSRKFAKVTLLDTTDFEKSIHGKNIGPEPLEASFTLPRFIERLTIRSNTKAKQALMDQELIAGIGNIYSDEILWVAGVHPERKIKDISKKEFVLMFKSMTEVLTKGIDFGGDSTSDYRKPDGLPGTFHYHHKAYQRTGEKCSRTKCPGIIQRMVIGGRSAHFCNTHQK